MKQARRRDAESAKAHSLFLTSGDIVLLKRALVALEQVLIVSPTSLPNRQFALETATRVQDKLSCLMQQHVCGDALPFSTNEVIILQTAVQLLAIQQPSDVTGTYETLKQCFLLQSRLALILARTRK